jgi:hypothetical protein
VELTNLGLGKDNKDIMPALGTMRARSAPGIWPEIEAALGDPEMIDDGNPQPSAETASTLKHVVEQAEQMLQNPVPPPHIEFLEGSIRLIWSNPVRNIRLVIASRPDRRSFLYHEEVQNGLGINEGIVEPTPENLVHWLTTMKS